MEVVSVSRTAGEDRITYSEITPDVVSSTTLIVNATPVGMSPHIDEAPEIPYDLLTPNHILFDLIYNPEKTLFLARGEMLGATVIGGGEMFRRQAEASWEIWNR
jgi:shikimate dehydrogenase